jgi:hypothetical protein
MREERSENVSVCKRVERKRAAMAAAASAAVKSWELRE